MTLARRGLLLCAGALSASLALPATVEAQALTVALSPQEIRVGDLVEATLSLELEAAAGEPSFPHWQRHWGTAEIRDVAELIRNDAGDGRLRYSQKLLLTAFRPGSVTLPPVSVTVPGEEPALEVATEPASFEVASVLPPNEEQLEPKPPAPPRALPLGNRFWWTGGLMAMIAAGLLTMILTRRGGETTLTGQSIDPWEAWERALARLAEEMDSETAFTGLSLELRRYLGRCLAFPAAESTTTELRRRLLQSGLPSSVGGEVVRLLVEADSVKFAKQTPPPGRRSEYLEQARLAATEVRSFLQRDEPDEQGEVAA